MHSLPQKHTVMTQCAGEATLKYKSKYITPAEDGGWWAGSPCRILQEFTAHCCSQNQNKINQTKITRTTRTPAFWGYPPPPHDYPYHRVILNPKSKEDKVKVTNLKNSPKFQIYEFWKKALQATHFLKLLDKMCKYEMDPMSIVEDTEWTRFCPQTDRRTDGQGDTSIPPFQLRWSGGYNHEIHIINLLWLSGKPSILHCSIASDCTIHFSFMSCWRYHHLPQRHGYSSMLCTTASPVSILVLWKASL